MTDMREPTFEIVEIPISQEMRELTDETLYLREHELRDLTPDQRAAFDEAEHDLNREIGERLLFGFPS